MAAPCWTAAARGVDRYGAQWIRIDVWTTNSALHEYYEKRGFEHCGLAPDETCPSRMLFQRPARYDSGNAIRICELDGEKDERPAALAAAC